MPLIHEFIIVSVAIKHFQSQFFFTLDIKAV